MKGQTGSFGQGSFAVLMYSENPCYPVVVWSDDPRVKKAGVTVDPVKGTWTYKGLNDSGYRVTNVNKIGESVTHSRGCYSGVIGVYDSRDISHLNRMARDVRETFKAQGSVLD